MIDEDSPTVIEITGSVAVVSFNRPAQRNPLSIATLQHLARVTSTLFPRNDIQTIVFTGTDDVFASGANIRELAQLNVETAVEFSRLGQNLFQAIADARQLTIAAINGYCIGGGLDLALACDIRVASKLAIFSHPGARRGIVTGWGGTQRLPRIIGRTRALEFFATGRRYSGPEALNMGLVTELGDPVVSTSLKLAGRTRKKVAGNPPPSVLPKQNSTS